MEKLSFEEWKKSDQTDYEISEKVLELYTFFDDRFTVEELKDKFLKLVYQKYLEENSDTEENT